MTARMISSRLISKIKSRLEREIGTVYKSHEGRLRFALAFPNTYYVGMSNLGFQTLYKLLNDFEEVVCERVFLPDPRDLAEMQRSRVPLFTIESGLPVREFDVLAFSLSYELDYPNVIKMLALAGLDLTAEARSRNARIPFVIAGGPAATFNPETMAPFIDAFVIGEAEEIATELVDAFLEGGQGRGEVLIRLGKIEGVYVPAFYEVKYKDDGTVCDVKPKHGFPATIRRRWTRHLELYPAVSSVLTPETEFSNMILAEVARGCGRKCRFCAAGYVFLPPRSGAPSAIIRQINEKEEKAAERLAGHPRIGLISASVFDHPSSLLICRSLVERERLFSISSTRADTLNRDIARVLHHGGQETLTIAPEAGTTRLRLAINKDMTDEEILRAASVAWDGGFRRLKLYFMLGLPTETDVDLEGIESLVASIANEFQWQRLTVSFSCFVPKPWTPFQWAEMNQERVLVGKLQSVSNSIRRLPGIEIKTESAREAIVQATLARGDRRLQQALINYSLNEISWRAAFTRAGVDPYFYAHRVRHKDEIFPWDHIDLGVRKQYLWQEYVRAMNSVPTPRCNVGICRACGICHG